MTAKRVPRVAPIKGGRQAPRRGMSFADVCALARRYPATEESTSYGTPALKVKGKLLVRLWEDGETLVLHTTFADRDHLLATWPQEFFITDHYAGYPAILVRLTKVDRARFAQLFEDAWLREAPAKVRKLREELNAQKSGHTHVAAASPKKTTPRTRGDG